MSTTATARWEWIPIWRLREIRRPGSPNISTARRSCRARWPGKGLEIAWLAEKVDAFFIQVQGAARLNMTDGRVMRITYAAKSGQRFSGPGRILADLGEIPLEQVTMQSIRAWFKANPHRIDEILHQNRSYVFFREAPVDDPLLGPIAAAKVPLTPGRSIAVDRLLHTFGTPFLYPRADADGVRRKENSGG